jgi:hypothetical protein
LLEQFVQELPGRMFGPDDSGDQQRDGNGKYAVTEGF